MIYHECSIAAVCCLDSIKPESPTVFQQTVRMLLDMQTRGQLAAGISTFDSRRSELVKTFKAIGSVDRAFGFSQPDKFRETESKFDGAISIGHTRYATTGRDDIRYAQPFERRHGQLWKWFAFAFNGTLSNHIDLQKKLSKQRGFHFVLNSDTEVIEHYIAHNLRGDTKPDLAAVMANLAENFDGAYCLVFLDACGRLMIARDPLGLRPLNWSKQNGLFASASESSALENIGFTDIHSVEPGEAIIVEDGLVSRRRYVESRKQARCFFEWVYFANVASSIDGKGVYESRATAGSLLAAKEHVPIDDQCIVVPVPDTAKAAADSFAYHLRMPCVEGIFRNRFIGRTFIQGSDTREAAARSKYTPLPSVLRGKRVFLVEDSIVRSTTLKALVGMIRKRCDPKEIHVRVACPPIIGPCYYGIDLSTIHELFAAQFSAPNEDAGQSRMAGELGVDSLRFLRVDDVSESIGIGLESLCAGCITGNYPTKSGSQRYAKAQYDFTAEKMRVNRA